MNKNKGFTLIELLVVIAIIGVLSSVVLASLNSARAKGADAAVKSNLNNIRAQAELVYDDANGSYAGVCTHATVLKAKAATSATCNSDANSWAMSAALKGETGGFWCVDYKGSAMRIEATLGAAKSCE